jgi:4'-phosphopantetheinyl transferase
LDRTEGADERVLSDVEIERADRFYAAIDRRRYLVGRSELRRRLAERCGTAPSSLRLVSGPQGKPSLVDHPDVDFNLSHADGWGLLAVTDGCAVGIDIEREQAGIAESGVAEHFFAPSEVARLSSLSADLQDRAFIECWTRKEAFLKGKGGGLSLPLDRFDVSFGDGQQARLLRAADNPADCGEWTLTDVTTYVPGGFVAALAVHAAAGTFTVAPFGQGQRGSM